MAHFAPSYFIIRPHRKHNVHVRPVGTGRVPSVRPLVTSVYCRKTAHSIEMPYSGSRWSRNHVQNGGPDSQVKGQISGGNGTAAINNSNILGVLGRLKGDSSLSFWFSATQLARAFAWQATGGHLS